jgi:hypothetical protein
MGTGGAVAALRLSYDRVVLYGCTLIFIALATAFIAPTWHADWANFWAGGATVGSADLLDAARHAGWQRAHHLTPQPFVYPPAVAFLFVPASRLSITAGFNVNCALMLLVCALCSLLAARIYALPLAAAFLATFAWVPAAQAGFLGQFTPAALLLSLVAIYGVVRKAPLISGLAVGLLLYKPQDAAAFVLLLLVRREYRALAIVSCSAIVWYLAGVAATAMDWSWPARYAGVLHDYYAADFAANRLKTVSVPGLLLSAGAPLAVAGLAGVLLLFSAIPRLRAGSALQAASMAPLLSTAASMHAYMYDAALALPALLLTLREGREPLRTPLICVAYALGPAWILALWLRFDPLAIVVVGGTVMWLLGGFTRRAPVLLRVLAGSRSKRSAH